MLERPRDGAVDKIGDDWWVKGKLVTADLDRRRERDVVLLEGFCHGPGSSPLRSGMPEALVVPAAFWSRFYQMPWQHPSQ
jgi:hypothetical protein